MRGILAGTGVWTDGLSHRGGDRGGEGAALGLDGSGTGVAAGVTLASVLTWGRTAQAGCDTRACSGIVLQSS